MSLSAYLCCRFIVNCQLSDFVIGDLPWSSPDNLIIMYWSAPNNSLYNPSAYSIFFFKNSFGLHPDGPWSFWINVEIRQIQRSWRTFGKKSLCLHLKPEHSCIGVKKENDAKIFARTTHIKNSAFIDVDFFFRSPLMLLLGI